MYNKDEIKNSLTIEQVFELVNELGGDPRMGNTNEYFVSATICHNLPGEGSHKLYYYDNTKLFRCYTECDDAFDIFELVQKIKGRETKREINLYEAVDFVASYFGIAQSFDENNFLFSCSDYKIFDKIISLKAKNLNKFEKIQLSTYDKNIFLRLPQPRIIEWEKENILPQIMISHEIRFDPINYAIIIPHFDIDGNLIGIRQRTMIQEEEKYGKYRPAIINYQMYNHPLGFNLYNLNNSKNNIRAIHKAIVFESEKSTLQYCSYFGDDADISCAVCGSSLSTYQVNLLLSLGVEEIIIGFDRQYKEIGDEEWKKWTEKLKHLHNKYNGFCQVSFLFDKEHVLDYKDSPTDKGKDIFLYLLNNRIFLKGKDCL